MKASSYLQETCYAPPKGDPSLGRFCYVAQDLEQRTLAGTVASNDADRFALCDLEVCFFSVPRIRLPTEDIDCSLLQRTIWVTLLGRRGLCKLVFCPSSGSSLLPQTPHWWCRKFRR
jgi:hypothetical protein